jgi:ankyrin repeat protein/uncharacterized protein YceK
MIQKTILFIFYCFTLLFLTSCGTIASRYGADPYLLDAPGNRVFSGVTADILAIRDEYYDKSTSNVPWPLDIPFSLAADILLLPWTISEEITTASLQKAAERGHAKEVSRLLEVSAKVNVNEMDPWGHTPLMGAAWFGHIDIVRTLLNEGAAVNIQSPTGWAALAYAAKNGRREIIQLLLSSKADPNGVADVRPLSYSSSRGDIDSVVMLIESGAGVNAAGRDGWTSLFSAASAGHTSVVELLLSKGADVNANLQSGGTALLWAACNGHEETVAVLIKYGADVNARRQLQPQHPSDSPLECARMHRAGKSIAEMLKRAGAIETWPDVGIKIKPIQGRAPLGEP